MKKLSVGLQATIEDHPLNTVVRSQDGDLDSEYATMTHVTGVRKLKLPDQFDGREVWKGLLPPVMNQGKCGSCWAFASTGSLGARFNIQSMGLLRVQLSALKLILCDFQGAELDLDASNALRSFADSVESSIDFGVLRQLPVGRVEILVSDWNMYRRMWPV